jgi:MtN3 and saliva related transmembrane protein
MEGPPLAVLVGTLAAALSICSFAPQIVKTWREKDASSVSLRMYLVTVTGFGCWLTYGIMIRAWPVIASNAACLVMSGVMLTLKLRFSRAD